MTKLLEDLNRKFVSGTPHMREIGVRITAVDKDRGSMTMPARPEWVGDPARGVLHPGVLTVLADSACGLAVGAALSKRVPYATLDLRMDYLRPAGPGHDLHCDAHCFRITRNVAFVRAEVWQDDRDQPIAVAQASFMLSTPAGSRTPKGAAEPPPVPQPSAKPASAFTRRAVCACNGVRCSPSCASERPMRPTWLREPVAVTRSVPWPRTTKVPA